MALELPKSRLNVRQIQTAKRTIPLDQIIQVQGQNPLATGIEEAGKVIGQTLQRRAELQRQGQQLAMASKIMGENIPPGMDIDTYLKLKKAQADAAENGPVIPSAPAAPSQSPAIPTPIGPQAPTMTPLPSPKGTPLDIEVGKVASGDFSTYNNLPKKKRDEVLTLAAHKQTADAKKIQQQALNQERDERHDEKMRNEILKYTESLERNPIAKKMREQGIALDQVTQMVDVGKQGNTVAASAMGTKMARAMGEVGVLTENDVRRYVQSGRLDRKSADTLSQWIQGRPTMATLKEIGQITNVLSDSFDDKIQPIHNTYINRLSRNYDMSPEKAAYLMDLQYKPTKMKKLEKPEGNDPLGIR